MCFTKNSQLTSPHLHITTPHNSHLIHRKHDIYYSDFLLLFFIINNESVHVHFVILIEDYAPE